ncbi:DMT family transporter [Simkania sp.]|uniref:DMT family transporter n=1 Tax=Simkania sp. TaxID=34094 RepID=UPI003B525982
MIQHLERPQHKFKLAVTLILIADLFCAIQAIFVKMASPYFSANTLVFGRCLVNLLMLYGWILFSTGGKGFKTLYRAKEWKLHLIRSVAGVGAVYCLYYGLALMPIGPATLLFFTFPIFIPIVARVWLRVAIIHRLWWGLGILFVLRPGAGLFNPAAFIPLLGAICGSVATVSIRVLHRYGEDTDTIMAYYFTAGVMVSGLILLFTREFLFETFTFATTSLIVLAGVFAALFQTVFTLSTKFATARFLSPFIYGIFIFSAVAEYFFWGKVPQMGTLWGFGFIAVGTILMIFLYPKDDIQFVPKKK